MNKEKEELVQTMQMEAPVQTMHYEEPAKNLQPVYQRPNGEDLGEADTVAINNVRDEQSRDIIDNGRLGSYDEHGLYVLSSEIAAQLINIPKILVNTTVADKFREGNDIYDLQTQVPGYGEIQFKLIVSKTEATLFLVENVYREAGGYLEVYEEKLSTLTIEKGIELKEIFSAFNIKKDGGDVDLGKVWGNGDFDEILIRKIYMAQLARNLLVLSSTGEREAFDKITAILKENGEYGKRVLKAFMARIESRPELIKTKDTAAYNRAINDVLASVIDIVTTPQDLKDNKIKEAYDQITTIRNEKIIKALPAAKLSVKMEDVQAAFSKIKGQAQSGEITKEFENKFRNVQAVVDQAGVRYQRVTPVPTLKKGKIAAAAPAAILKQQVLTDKERLGDLLNKKATAKAAAPAGQTGPVTKKGTPSAAPTVKKTGPIAAPKAAGKTGSVTKKGAAKKEETKPDYSGGSLYTEVIDKDGNITYIPANPKTFNPNATYVHIDKQGNIHPAGAPASVVTKGGRGNVVEVPIVETPADTIAKGATVVETPANAGGGKTIFETPANAGGGVGTSRVEKEAPVAGTPREILDNANTPGSGTISGGTSKGDSGRTGEFTAPPINPVEPVQPTIEEIDDPGETDYNAPKIQAVGSIEVYKQNEEPTVVEDSTGGIGVYEQELKTTAFEGATGSAFEGATGGIYGFEPENVSGFKVDDLTQGGGQGD